MWHKGVIGITLEDGSSVRVRYEVKSYDEGSVYGINEGRISKLWLQIDGVCVTNYDRGWDIEPTCEAAEKALCILLKEYN